jgi:hypothetical protein
MLAGESRRFGLGDMPRRAVKQAELTLGGHSLTWASGKKHQGAVSVEVVVHLCEVHVDLPNRTLWKHQAMGHLHQGKREVSSGEGNSKLRLVCFFVNVLMCVRFSYLWVHLCVLMRAWFCHQVNVCVLRWGVGDGVWVGKKQKQKKSLRFVRPSFDIGEVE